ncbi:hypothetical protein IFT67_10795 [Sphingomonas sp. CFBP 13728]|uniref:hypothetical protein n=1 Tax=Sphingomonas sp. CFBP 13728 TaxID=2775294 RepID=UPI00177DD524|nr:hypothetical protein [Sphingomonas sp. CFBP 13728]MBD8619407.1 hypothetical protein [Sphingomonas sp. CFBP 13728]
MTTIRSIAVTTLTLMIALSPERATAQTRTSAQLADQWREARRAELLEQREKARTDLSMREAVIASELKALDRDSTPDSIAATAPASLPSNKTVTTTAVTLTAAPDGSGQKTTNTTSTSTEVLPPKSDKPDKPPADASAGAGAGAGRQPFGGLDFGIGVSYTGDVGSSDRIGTAMLDSNGIVRVTDKNNVNARIMLESHYFFTPNKSFLFGSRNYADDRDDYGNIITPGQKMWGIGPFIALRPGSDDVIDAIGMGIMVGFRRSPDSKESFNFGIGAVVDPSVRVLGKGIIADAVLPAGEIEVRYRETSQLGVLLLTSFSF